MRDLESFYLRLPIVFQQAACSLEGWRIRHTRYDDRFFEMLHASEERTFWTAERLRSFRDARLSEFVRHCARTVPYYRRKFCEWGVVPEDIRRLEDLRRLPVLTKDEIRENSEALLCEAVPRRKYVMTHTSGTTGSGLHFATTQLALQEQWATWWRYRRWHGIDLDTWCGYFAGRSVVPIAQQRSPWWRYNYPMRQIIFSGYHMSEATLPQYVAELRKSRPPWLSGYPSLLALLASHLLNTGADLGYEVRWITTASENLLPQQSRLISRAFGTRPIQHYGMTEAVANFSECERGNLHVDEDFAAVEFVPDPAGAGWKVVGTNLSNPATPLLRYEVQDQATPSVESCPCGRSGRLVDRVDGRLEDYVVLKNGAMLGRLDHVFKDLVRIREVQIYQRKVGEIIVRVVPGRGYSDRDEATLLSELRKRVGHQADVEIEYLRQVERSKNGKLRFVISEVSSLLSISNVAGQAIAEGSSRQ